MRPISNYYKQFIILVSPINVMRNILFLVCLVLFVSSCDEEVEGCVDSLAENYNVEATLDDGSCEYIEIGANYQGGIVFYIDSTGEHGLIAAFEDLVEGSNLGVEGISEGFEWGCNRVWVNGANGKVIGTGSQNTLDIVAFNCETEQGGVTAAQAALDYYSKSYADWYLPSIDELMEMYNTIGNRSSLGDIGSFETSDYPYYWSSTQKLFIAGRSINFYDGTRETFLKHFSLRVRPIRSF
jgi:hypothetical protein